MTTRPRRHDPERRDRIIEAALDVIAAHGVAGTTHRRVAERADVPLGSMTYHFAGLEDLLHTAFTRLAESMSRQFAGRLGAARTTEEAEEAVVDIILGEPGSNERTLLLSYELYAFAARHPPLRSVMRDWMERSQAALRQHFEPGTARALDALIEGLMIHRSVDPAPLGAAGIRAIVRKLARP
ncbi:TetR/AcrR family transcriptional regulator [Roseomonas populi]|uniref:TetR family transcriptional regulator n=1 Tax=Roseomonas populi TaxID=3121582 RepID=A0ABT1X5M0_9PROT|nr:TetR family transcriptional regulator [Roseomonas pecuniae]MCR0983407.1 TetR family transcriptional regulator [Roseomonas pecuniae]